MKDAFPVFVLPYVDQPKILRAVPMMKSVSPLIIVQLKPVSLELIMVTVVMRVFKTASKAPFALAARAPPCPMVPIVSPISTVLLASTAALISASLESL